MTTWMGRRRPPPGDYAGVGLTYAQPGATRVDPMPAGYRRLERARVVGSGRPAFDRAARALLGWRLHEAAGFAPDADRRTAAPGAVVVLAIGVGPIRLIAPCRVIYVVDEPRRRGFAYGTLPGHPETGEEAFLLDHHEEDDVVTFTVRTFSRPATLLARIGTPLTYLGQELGVRRYLATMAWLTSW